MMTRDLRVKDLKDNSKTCPVQVINTQLGTLRIGQNKLNLDLLIPIHELKTKISWER
ncbi:hypothetical protein OIU78_015112 [Salix suchowensis]|nr:hypothetical protein OIU78_015112 [Salix suchowensis]